MATRRRLAKALALVLAVGVVLTATAANEPSEDQLFTTGKHHYDQRSYQPATQAFEDLLKRFPKSARARQVQYLLADAYHKARRLGREHVWPKAEAAYKKLADSPTEDLWRARAQTGLARLYLQHNYHQHRDDMDKLYAGAVATYARKVTKTSPRELRREFAEVHITRLEAGIRTYSYDPNWQENLKKLKERLKGGGAPAPPPPPARPVQLQQKLAPRRIAPMPIPPRPAPRPQLDEQTKKRYAFYAEVDALIEKVDELAAGNDLSARARWTVGQRGGDKQLEEIIQMFADTEWHDDALITLARRRESQQKHLEALALYGQLLDRYSPNKSRYIKQAQRQIASIKKPTIGVRCAYAYVPGTKPEFTYSWRNQTQATFRLYRTEPFGHSHHTSLIEMARAGRNQEIKTWTRDLKNDAKHMHHSAQEPLDLADEGAYL
ncbi:outer membrane protein assembly factor BamD, partial [bacterium]|nr:outer membrane protein assembly factor BamD [bacterium]